jgi:hypothetical protein
MMVNKPVIHIVASQCQPADDEKFNKWYNEVHIPMLLKFKKLQGITRYKIALDNPKQPKYITIYKFASFKDFEAYSVSPELADAVEEMKETWGKKIELISKVQYEEIKEWGKA